MGKQLEITTADADTGEVRSRPDERDFFIRNLEAQAGSSILRRGPGFDIAATTGAGSVDENYLNESRLRLLRQQFTTKLLTLIEEEDFEYGIESKVDIVIREQMSHNALATKSWLNSIFVENFANVSVVVGLLRIIARIDYLDIQPEGQTMAMAALSHRNTEVQECGVRAFENWGGLESARLLENLRVSTPWLQEYIDEVAKDLRQEYGILAD